jgi:outer membrane protein assembly factor BamD (BamD/ComL family)
MKQLITLLIITISLNNQAFVGKLLEAAAGGPKNLPNCDSEAIKERKYDKDFSDQYWMKQLNKAQKKGDYCRQAQLWWHFYLVMPKYYMDNQGHEQTIKALYKGNFFLELQWQIKNFRKERGHKESVDYMQVSSYWKHIDEQAKRDEKRNGCFNTLGYYEDPISGERFTLLEEGFMSTNDFLKRYPESVHAQEVEKAKKHLKDLNGRKLLCSAKSSFKIMENSKNRIGAENYWSIYTRLAQILANYQESKAVEESLYLMAVIIKKIDAMTEGRSNSPVDETFDFLYQENWNTKLDQIIDILVVEYSSSPWTQKVRQEFL